MGELAKTRLGRSEIKVTRLALGLWPIAGMTSLHVNQEDSLATIHQALDDGVTFFDTAYCYGPDGESERLLGQAIRDRRDEVVVATKGGVHWASDLSRVNDASPDRLRKECEASLNRLQQDHVDLWYLHSPDRVTPIEDSAAACQGLKDSGKTRAIGLSNATLEEIKQFHAVCPLDAVQLRYNMLQRGIESEIMPWCAQAGVTVVGYWPLIKGLLAGKIRRDFVFEANDKRQTYDLFQPPQWDWNQDLLDGLEGLAGEVKLTIAQLVIAWTLSQPDLGVALVGAKRPWQIAETLEGARVALPAETLRRIEELLRRRQARSA